MSPGSDEKHTERHSRELHYPLGAEDAVPVGCPALPGGRGTVPCVSPHLRRTCWSNRAGGGGLERLQIKEGAGYACAPAAPGCNTFHTNKVQVLGDCVRLPARLNSVWIVPPVPGPLPPHTW